MLQPPAPSLALIDAPTPPDPGPFATRIGGADKNTHFSELGEDVIVDPKGRVWLTEGGGLLYDGPLPNHSRVVGYDPSAPAANRFRVYNLPGDHNEIIGLAWDSARNRLWLAQGNLQTGPRLLSFDPEQTPFDNTFDFSQPLDSLLHSALDANPTGYRVYPLPTPRNAYPAHLMVESDGSVWFTAYIGNAIGRLDPTTGAVVSLPLPKPASTNPAARSFGTGGPWDIVASPGGGLAFNSQFDNTLSRLDAARMSHLALCLQLDRSGRNPCLRTISVPGDLTHELIHSAAFDSAGRLWFSQHAFGAAAGTLVSIGFVDASWNFVVMLPAIPTVPGETSDTAANDGIAIDPRSGDIWFAEYFRHRVSRLHHV
jgi:streptogramin lyase